MTRLRRLLLCFATVMALVLLKCTASYASAGGGHGFRGGGGGFRGGGGFGGGGHGHGSGGADLFGLLYWMIVLHPGIGIPILIVAAALFIYSIRNGQTAYQSNVIARGSRILNQREREAKLASLKQADPMFDESSLVRRARLAFHKVQDAWSLQQMENVRAFVSDGVFERFNLQIDEQKSLGYRNAMDNVAVQGVEFAQIFSDRLFDQISLRIECTADDHNVSLETGKRLSTNAVGQFIEIWTFIRRRGATSAAPDKPGLIEGACPNCGAPIEMNQNANCAHCRALLRSGEYDWVLSEITQESEWRATEAKELPGVDEIVSRDPEFNLQELEDRASVIFWRRATAERVASERPLRGVASEHFCKEYGSDLARRNESGRSYLGECSVGSVNTLGVILGNELDQALVEVHWWGRRFIVSNGQPLRTENGSFQHSVLVLARRSGVKTDIERAISSAHCPNCGAPSTSSAGSGACESCGTILNDGSRGWILAATMTPAQARAKLMEQRQQSTGSSKEDAQALNGAPSPAGLLSWMVKAAGADGEVSPRELEMLIQTAQRHHVPRERVDELIRASLRNQLESPEPANSLQARSWLAAMATEAMADGKLTRQEYALLCATGARAGLTEFDIRLLLRNTRADMYAAAKNALRSKI
jgi:uncharacterized Zn finger protein (UPF0148 family)